MAQIDEDKLNEPAWVINYINALMDVIRVLRKLDLAKQDSAAIAVEEIRRREEALMPHFRYQRIW